MYHACEIHRTYRKIVSSCSFGRVKTYEERKEGRKHGHETYFLTKDNDDERHDIGTGWGGVTRARSRQRGNKRHDGDSRGSIQFHVHVKRNVGPGKRSAARSKCFKWFEPTGLLIGHVTITSEEASPSGNSCTRHFLSNTCSTKINLLHAFACNHFAKRAPLSLSVSVSNFRGIKAALELTCACALRIISIDSEEKLLLLLTSNLKYLSRDKIMS